MVCKSHIRHKLTSRDRAEVARQAHYLKVGGSIPPPATTITHFGNFMEYQTKPIKPEKCELCGSTEDYLNFHHLIPRTLHSVKRFEKLYDKNYMKHHGIWICKAHCHKQIHVFIEEKEMGNHYNTLQKLKEHSEVKKYIEWRSKRVK